MYVGRTEESLAQIKRALEFDPFSLSINTSLGFRLCYARQYDQAIEQLHKTLDMEPNRLQTRLWLARAYALKGRTEEALAELQKARQQEESAETLATLGYTLAVAGKRNEALAVLTELKALALHRYVAPNYFAEIHLGLGELDQTFARRQKADEERAAGLYALKVNPMFDGLRTNPRFTDMVLAPRAVNLRRRRASARQANQPNDLMRRSANWARATNSGCD